MSLRIAIDGRCLTDHYPGIGRYLFNLLRSLPAVAEEAEFYLFTADGEANSRFELESLEDLGVQLIPTSSPIRGVGQQFELRREMRRLEAEVFHAPYFLTSYRPACPMVLGFYDTIATRSPRDLPSPQARMAARLATRLALKSARTVITLSRFVKDDLVKTFRLPPERVVVTPGAAAEDFAPAPPEAIAELRSRLGLPERYALHVGTNKPHKNLARLMEAWAEVRGFEDSDCGLVFAGAHDRRHFRADSTARRLGFGDVRCLGAVAERDLPALYSGAEIFVLPSLYEGFGLPVLEAMACGTPVACSQASSLPEVALHAAAYFDPEDTASIAAALARLLKNPGYRRILGERGRGRAGQLSWKQTARLTLDAYRQAVERA